MTPEQIQAMLAEHQANASLNQQGSLMGSQRQEQQQGSQDPLLATIKQLLNTLGPSPTDALSGQAGKLAGQAGIGQLVQSLLGGGQQGSGNEAGVYRQLGMQRAGGLLNPAEYIQKLQELPNYQRYLQLVQGIVKRGLGEQFPIARGKAQTDPLIQALQQGQTGSQLPITAVTHDVLGAGKASGGQDFSNFAEGFAKQEAEKTRKPAYVAQGMARPEDVAALVPRRQAYTHEKELVLKPTDQFNPQLTAKYIPPSGAFPFVERKGLATPQLPQDYLQAIQAALASAAQPPR